MAIGYNTIEQQFQAILGRAPTQAEYSHFNDFIKNEQLSADEVGQILQSSPEFQQSLLRKNTAEYGDMLAKSDADILGKAGAEINSRFASLGRPVSSGQAGALSQVAGNLAQQRQSALSDFYGRGMQQNASLYSGRGQNATNRGYALKDEMRQRGYQLEDYYRQKRDYDDAMNAKSGWNAITPEFAVGQGIGLIGQLGAAKIGAMGGAGGGAGGMGSFAGGFAGGLFNRNSGRGGR